MRRIPRATTPQPGTCTIDANGCAATLARTDAQHVRTSRHARFRTSTVRCEFKTQMSSARRGGPPCGAQQARSVPARLCARASGAMNRCAVPMHDGDGETIPRARPNDLRGRAGFAAWITVAGSDHVPRIAAALQHRNRDAFGQGILVALQAAPVARHPASRLAGEELGDFRRLFRRRMRLLDQAVGA